MLNRKTVSVLGLGILVFGIFVLTFLMKGTFPPVADEVDFMKPIESWIQSGPTLDGLWHQPFYPWMLAGLGKVFGHMPLVARLVGVLCLSFATLIFLKISAKWCLESRFVAFAVLLLSPAPLGAALLLDYDTTLLVLTSAIFFGAVIYFDFPSWKKSKTILVFGLLLALCFMAKETTPLAYPVALFVSLLLLRRKRDAVIVSTGTVFVGVLVSLAATYLWCRYYQLPLTKVFQTDLIALSSRAPGFGTESRSIGSSLWMKLMPLFWFGPGVIGLFFVFVSSWKEREIREIGVLSAVFTVVFVYTFVLAQATYHFPKYMAPVIPWVIWFSISTLRNEKLEGSWRYLLFSFVLIVWFLSVPDSLNLIYYRDLRSLLHYCLVFLVPTIFWAIWVLKLQKSAPNMRIFFACIAFAFAVAHPLRLLRTDRSFHNWYGESAISEVLSLATQWKAQFPNGTIYSTAKDLAYAPSTVVGVPEIKFQPAWELNQMSAELCASKQTALPLLIVTRIREDTSILRSELLAPYRECLKPIGQGEDIVYWGRE